MVHYRVGLGTWAERAINSAPYSKIMEFANFIPNGDFLLDIVIISKSHF